MVLSWNGQNRYFILRPNSWFTTDQLQWFPIRSGWYIFNAIVFFLISRFKRREAASPDNQGKHKFRKLPTILSARTWRSLLSSICNTDKQCNGMLSTGSGTRRTKYPVGCKLREMSLLPLLWLIRSEKWWSTLSIGLTNIYRSRLKAIGHYWSLINNIMAL